MNFSESQSCTDDAKNTVRGVYTMQGVCSRQNLHSAEGIVAASLLGPAQIREIAAALGVNPTKKLGQNFMHDAVSVRRIVAESGISGAVSGDAGVLAADKAGEAYSAVRAVTVMPADERAAAGARVLEVGPGLGSLTLALLEAGACVSAIEIDPVLAQALPRTVQSFQPSAADYFAVLRADALSISRAEQLAVPPALGRGVYEPTHLVANLPYNVAVPVLLTLLEALPSLRSVTVLVQAEVADRLAAEPGSRTYGVPSVKAAWYGKARRGIKISRNVFWPVPNVDSALVHMDIDRVGEAAGVDRESVFAVVDAAFSQRRKTLRSALAGWAGSAARAEGILRTAGVDPQLRGEKLGLQEFVRIAKVH